MKLRPEEITAILKQRIEEYEVETDLAEVGTVLQIGDGISRVYGLERCAAMEMLEFEHGVTGLHSSAAAGFPDRVGTPVGVARDHLDL